MSKYLQKLHLMDSSLYEDSILYILLCLLQTVWQLSPHLTTYTEQKKKIKLSSCILSQGLFGF